MNQSEENKIQKIIELMEENRLIMARMLMLCDQLEKEFRVRLNDDFSIKA
jgi:hypothetical protein